MQFLYIKKHGVYPTYPHVVSDESQLAEFAAARLKKRRYNAKIMFTYDIVSNKFYVPALIKCSSCTAQGKRRFNIKTLIFVMISGKLPYNY